MELAHTEGTLFSRKKDGQERSEAMGKHRGRGRSGQAWTNAQRSAGGSPGAVWGLLDPAVTESWIQTSGSQTPSKSLSRTQNSYPLKTPKVSQTEHTPTNGESVDRQKLSREWGRVVGFSWMLSKTSKYARMPSSTQ